MENKKKSKRGWIACMLLTALLLAIGIPAPFGAAKESIGVETVEAATKNVLIQFRDNDGSSSYTSLRMKVKAGSTIELPKVPAVSGYTSLGWATKKGAAKATYKAGAEITVKKNISLYAVRQKTASCTASFYNNKGKTNTTYKKLAIKTTKGSYIKLPGVPELTGYEGVGWTTKKGAAAPVYKAGQKVKLSKSTKYYAVYKKADVCTVNFYLPSGKSNSSYKKLTKKVTKKALIQLPSVPEQSGYVSLGWSTAKNSSSAKYSVGQSYRVKKNMKFYAVLKTAATVTLCKNDGTVYKTVKVGKGDYLSLPAVESAPGYTFMGWSSQPRQNVMKESTGYYEAGEKIRINGNTRLYAVAFNRSSEANLTELDMRESNGWNLKYKQVIFVGDSRTERMKETLNKEFGADSLLLRNVHFVAGTGMGVNWLKSDGYTELMKIINQNYSVQKPTAVIFNLGINDLASLPEYLSYMKELAGALSAKNCKLFYMSVNPVNSKMNAKTGHAVRNEADVRQFNSYIKSNLGQIYTFIDTYSWLMQTGYSTDENPYGVDNNIDDGLHYSTRTYKRIYHYCLDFLQNHN